MAKRTVIWTEKAFLERKEILEYWIRRNQSKSFSIKLNTLILKELNLISLNPSTGKKTNYENIRLRIIWDYLLLYEISKTEIIILIIWDSRRNPENLTIK